MAQKVRVSEVEPWRVLPHAYSATAVRCPTHGVIHRVSLDGRRMRCRQCGAATTDTAVGSLHAGKFFLDSVIEPVDGWTDETPP
jgi:hypothetical protein